MPSVALIGTYSLFIWSDYNHFGTVGKRNHNYGLNPFRIELLVTYCTLPLNLFVSPLFFLFSRRFLFCARDTVVFLRFLGVFKATKSKVQNRLMAASRFARCERYFEEETRSTPSLLIRVESFFRIRVR